MSAPSSSSSSSFQTRYDVFLNFRGKDTRNGFTAHLYEALCSKEIQTFMDADKILKGEEISPALVTAMDKSMFCVVVLSKNYPSSPWCLDELVQILSCKNDKKQTVLPIFYGVNPSDVREQRGRFGKAFARLEKKFKEEMERVQKWKQALTDVANISGWVARNRHEPTLIKEIIEHISSRLINNRSEVDVDERISLPDIPTLPTEISEFQLPTKRKMNEAEEIEIRGKASRVELSDFLISPSIDDDLPDLLDFDIHSYRAALKLAIEPARSGQALYDDPPYLEIPLVLGDPTRQPIV